VPPGWPGMLPPGLGWGWGLGLPWLWPGFSGTAATAVQGGVPAAAAAAAVAGRGRVSRKKQQAVEEVAELTDDWDDAAYLSDDDWQVDKPAGKGRPVQVARVVYKVSGGGWEVLPYCVSGVAEAGVLLHPFASQTTPAV
jgi:hypothetical protein